MKVGIALAIFKPNFEFLSAQLKSIESQTRKYDILIIGIDQLDFDASLLELISSMPNMEIQFSNNLGSFRVFEKLTEKLLEKNVDIVMFSDQDDIWNPNKIQSHVDIFSADPEKKIYLCHSDLSVIDGNHKILQTSLFDFEQRIGPPTNFSNQILRNNVTGCAMSIRNELAQISIPFPNQLAALGVHHDAWLNAIAGAMYGISYIPLQLVQYRNHGMNQVGVQKNAFRYKRARSRLHAFRIRRILNRNVIDRLNSRDCVVDISDNIRFDERPVNFLLQLYLKNFRKSHSELIRDFIFGGIFWHVLSPITKFKFIFEKYLRRLSKFISLFLYLVRMLLKKSTYYKIYEYYMRNKVNFSTGEPFINMAFSKSPTDESKIYCFIPHLPPVPIFGGIITALEFANELSLQTKKSLVFVSTNHKVENTRETLKLINPLVTNPNTFIFDYRDELLLSAEDIMVSTAWWTAEFVEKIQKTIDFNIKHFYLIQDFEPGFYPWSYDYVRAIETYGKNSIKIFNTKILQDYFIEKGLTNEATSYNFLPPQLRELIQIPRVSHLNATNLVFYYRPSVNRNLSDLTIKSIQHFLENRRLGVPITITSIGESNGGLELCGIKVVDGAFKPLEQYRDLLSSMDIGLSLMASPHPSYPPLEMALLGLHVVTNQFENKNSKSIPKLIFSQATPEEIGRALIFAEEEHLKGSQVTQLDKEQIINSLGQNTICELVSRLNETHIQVKQ